MGDFVRNCSRGYLLFVCFIVALLGLGMTAAGSWAYLNFDAVSNLVSRTGLVVTIVTGVCAFLVSLMGCSGASSGNRCSLLIFCGVILALLCLQIAGAVLFSAYMGQLDDVTALNKTAANLKKEAEIQINDFIYSSYFSCCYNNTDVCDLLHGKPCMPVYNCDQIPVIPHPEQKLACYRDNKNHPGKPPLYIPPAPPDIVRKGVCTIFKDAKITCDTDSVKIAGVVSPKLYQRSVYQFLSDNLAFIAYISAGVAGIEFFAVVSTVCLLCNRRKYRRDTEFDSYMMYREIR